jgi:hypothetical protein
MKRDKKAIDNAYFKSTKNQNAQDQWHLKISKIT